MLVGLVASGVRQGVGFHAAVLDGFPRDVNFKELN